MRGCIGAGMVALVVAGAVGCGGSGGAPVEADVTLTASDGKRIAATFTHPGGGRAPAVLLVHGFTNDRRSWEAVGLVDALDARGYATLAIDVRGHGESDPADALLDLLSDPDQAPRDVRAGLAYLRGRDRVDAGRIAAVGSSMGANLSVAAMARGEGLAAVGPISPRLAAIEDLADHPPSLDLHAILCIATQGDDAGLRAETCQTLVDSAQAPAEQLIYPDGDEHGLAILETYPDAVPTLLDFLDRAL